MPLYDIECEACGHIWEEIYPYDAPDPPCPLCNNEGKRLLTFGHRSCLQIFEGFWHEDLSLDMQPVFVRSKSHYKELCKKNGVYAPHVFDGPKWNISEI